MKVLASIASLVTAFASGAILVVACSDDSPADADAASCPCAAAEPPLAGRIAPAVITAPIQSGTSVALTAQCPAGAILLGGGCRLDTIGAVVLEDAGASRSGSQAGYVCHWRSNAPDNRMGTVEAICLSPAP